MTARGLTLIEVLAAMAITAIMGAMVAGAIGQVGNAADATRAQDERYGEARRALTRLSSELAMAFVSDHFDAAQHSNGRPTLFRGREDELLFTTMAHVRLYRSAKESDQAVVEYTVESDPARSGEEALFRREKPRLDGEPERGGRKDLVADRVTGLRLQYWDPTRKEWMREWSTRSAERMNDLPVRVRIELEVGGPGGPAAKLVTEARVALTRPLDF